MNSYLVGFDARPGMQREEQRRQQHHASVGNAFLEQEQRTQGETNAQVVEPVPMSQTLMRGTSVLLHPGPGIDHKRPPGQQLQSEHDQPPPPTLVWQPTMGPSISDGGRLGGGDCGAPGLSRLKVRVTGRPELSVENDLDPGGHELQKKALATYAPVRILDTGRISSAGTSAL